MLHSIIVCNTNAIPFYVLLLRLRSYNVVVFRFFRFFFFYSFAHTFQWIKDEALPTKPSLKIITQTESSNFSSLLFLHLCTIYMHHILNDHFVEKRKYNIKLILNMKFFGFGNVHINDEWLMWLYAVECRYWYWIGSIDYRTVVALESTTIRPEFGSFRFN